MAGSRSDSSRNAGFTLAELVVVLAGICIILGLAIPVLKTAIDHHRITDAAESIVAQLAYARTRALSSHEAFQVDFPAGQKTYQVETGMGSVIAGPFSLPLGVTWNTIDSGNDVTFPSRIISFQPNGSVAAGESGRVKLISPSGIRIDIVVDEYSTISQTPLYSNPPAPF